MMRGIREGPKANERMEIELFGRLYICENDQVDG